MSDVQHPGNTILQAEPHGNQGIDAAHQQTGNHYVQNVTIIMMVPSFLMTMQAFQKAHKTNPLEE